MAISDGTFTIEYPNGEHRTLRIKTIKGGSTFLNGKQKVGFLAGSDNETSYRWVGHYDENGNFRFWRNAGFDADRERRFRRALEVIAGAPEMAGRAYARRSGNCYRCGRKLTHPTSLDTGIGPECGRRRNETAAERRAARRAA